MSNTNDDLEHLAIRSNLGAALTVYCLTLVSNLQHPTFYYIHEFSTVFSTVVEALIYEDLVTSYVRICAGYQFYAADYYILTRLSLASYFPLDSAKKFKLAEGMTDIIREKLN